MQSLCQIDAIRLAAFVTSDRGKQRMEPNGCILIKNNRVETPSLDCSDLIDPRMQASLRICETTVHGYFTHLNFPTQRNQEKKESFLVQLPVAGARLLNVENQA